MIESKTSSVSEIVLIKDNRRADKITSGPQSHILEGVSWEEAKKLQDANISATGDQVILVGAASKGIIQRGFQHNALVYKTPYAKNPFDTVTDEELEEYKKVVERKQKGESFDDDQSESEPLSSSLQNSRPLDGMDAVKSPLMSPMSATSETEEESKDEPRVLRIETKQVPRPSQAEVVLSDAESDLPDPSVERSMSLRIPAKVADATDVEGQMSRSWSLGRDKTKMKDASDPVCVHIARLGMLPSLQNVSFPGLLPAWHFTNFHPVLSSNTRHPVLISNLITKAHSFDAKAFECVCVHSLSTEDVDCTVSAEQLSKTTMNVCASLNAPHISVVSDLDECSSVNVGQTLVKSITIPECKNIAEYSVFGQHAGMTFQAGAANNIDSVHTKEVSFNACSFEFLDHHIIVEHSSAAHFETTYAKCMENSTYEESVVNTRDIMNQGSDALSSTDAGFLDKMDKTEIEETVHPVPDRFDLHVLNYSSHEVSVIACSGTMGCDLDEMAETELKEKSIVTCNFDSHDSTFSGRESSLAQNGGRTNPATLDMKNKGVEILSEERNLIGITVNHNIHNVSAEDSSFSFHHDTSLTQDKVVFQDSHISDLERRKTRKSDKALHTPDFKACSLDMYDKESSIIEDGVTRHHIPAYIVAQKVGFTDVERRMTGGEDTACHSPSLNVQNVTFSDQEGSIVGDVGTSHHATAYFEDEEIGPSDQEESVIEDVGTSHHTTAYFEAEEIGPSDQEESIIGDVCTSHHTTAYFEAEEIGPSDEAGVVTGGGDTVYQISSLKVQDNDLSDKEGSVNGEGDTYHTAAYLEAQKIDFCDEERNKKADGNTAHYSSDFFEAQGICFTNQEGCQYGDGVIACNIILDGEKTEVTVPGKLSHPKETVENDGTRFSENHSDRLLLPGFSYALYEEDDDNVFHHVGNEPKELYDSGIRTCTVCTKNDSIQQDKVVIQEPGAHSSDEHITIGKLGENTVSECAAGMNESSSAESVNEYADEYYSDSVEYFLVDSNFSEFTEFCKDKSSEFYSKDVGLYNHVEFYSKDKNASMPEMFYSKDENKTHFVKFSSSSNATTKCKESCASSTHTQQCTECYMTNVHDSPEYHEKSYKSQKQKKMYSKKCKHNYTENKHAPCNAMERKNSDEFLFSNSRNVNVDCFHETTESSATSNVFPENNFNVFSKSESNACDNTHVSQIDISYESPAECENELHNHARGRCVSSESYSSHETNKFRGNNQYKNSISNNDNLASAYHAKGSNKDTYSEKYMTLVLSRSKESAYNFKVANCEKYTKTPASCNDVGGVYVKPRGLTFSYNEGNGIKETCEAMGEENVHTEYKIGLSGNSFENNSRHNRIDVFKLKIVNFEESLKLDPLILHNLFLARMKLVMDEEIMLKLMLQNSDFERLNLYIRLKCFEGTEDGYSSDSEHTEDKIVANNVVVTADGKVALNETYCLSEHVQFNALNKSLCNAAHINIEKGVLIWVSYERTKCPCSQKVLSTTIVHCRHLAVCDHNNSEEMDMASEYSSEAQQHVWFHLHVSCLQCEVERCMLDDGNGCVDSSINGDYLVCDCKNFSESVASSGSDNIMLMDLNDNYVKRISFPVVENNPRQDVENLVTVNVTNPHGGICANSSDNLKQIMGLERCALGHVVEKAIVEIGNNCGVCSHHSPVRNKEASSEEDKESFVWENPHAFNWKGDHYADDFSERNCKSFEDLTFNSSDSVMELGDWSNGEDNEESVYVMAGNDSAYSPIAESKGYHKFSADYGKDDLQGCYENDKSPRMIKLKGARCIQATTDNQSLLCDNIFDMSSIHKGTINEQNYLDQERYQFDASSANSSDSTGSCGSGNGVCLADHIMQPFPDFSRYLYLTVDDNTQDAESTETPDFSLQSSGVQEEILHVEKEECDAETQTENFDSHSDFPVTFPTVYCANKPLFCCVVDPEFAEHGTSSNYSFPSSLHAFNRVTQNFQQTSFTLDTITEED